MPKDAPQKDNPEAAAKANEGAGAEALAPVAKVAKVKAPCRVTYKRQTLEFRAGQEIVDNDELAAFLVSNGLAERG